MTQRRRYTYKIGIAPSLQKMITLLFYNKKTFAPLKLDSLSYTMTY